jgi:hypothetical protein
MSSQFKQATGGDAVNIEQKYKKSYGTYLDTKFIFTTNKEIQISSQVSDIRRLIYVVMSRNSSAPTTDYEERLWAERAGILFKCREVYRKMLGQHGAIVFDTEAARDAAQNLELKFQIMFDDHLILKSDSYVSSKALLERLMLAHQTRMANQDYSEFKEWLKRTFGIEEKKKKLEDGRTARILFGLATKSVVQKIPIVSAEPLTNVD